MHHPKSVQVAVGIHRNGHTYGVESGRGAVKTDLSQSSTQGFHVNPVDMVSVNHRVLNLAHSHHKLVTISFNHGQMFLPALVVGVVHFQGLHLFTATVKPCP